MVARRCSSISAPGSHYLRVRRNDKPLGRCGLNDALPNCIENCQKSRQLGAVRTRTVLTCDQAYKAWSQRWITEAIFESVICIIDRILNNSLRLSSVLCVECFSLLVPSIPSLRCCLFIATSQALTPSCYNHERPYRYRVYICNAVLKHYTPDNQAIHCRQRQT